MDNYHSTHSNSQIAVHPSETYKKDWTLAEKMSIHQEGLTIDYAIEPPGELECPPLTHNFLMLLLNNGTRQITRLDGKEYDGVVRPKEFALQPANASGFYSWESTDRCLLFTIDPKFLYKIAVQTECLNSSKIEILPILKAHDSQIENLALLFLQEIQNGGIAGKLYTESLANAFAIHLLREYCAFPAKLKEFTGGLPPYKLKQAIEYINDNLDQQIKLTDIAKLIDISQYYFCRLFHDSMGVSPYQYVIQQRVAKAKDLIENSQLPLVEISYECGFSSQSQMTQHFRKLTGVTPKVYRNKL